MSIKSIMSSKTSFFYNQLAHIAMSSDIEQKLAAGIVKAGKIQGNPCPNSSRNVFRGMTCGSLHAEANAILSYYPKDLTWTQERGWCFLRGKGKVAKDKEEQVRYCCDAS